MWCILLVSPICITTNVFAHLVCLDFSRTSANRSQKFLPCSVYKFMVAKGALPKRVLLQPIYVLVLISLAAAVEEIIGWWQESDCVFPHV